MLACEVTWRLWQPLGVWLTQGPHCSALGKPSPRLRKALPPVGCPCQATFQKEHGRDTQQDLLWEIPLSADGQFWLPDSPSVLPNPLLTTPQPRTPPPNLLSIFASLGVRLPWCSHGPPRLPQLSCHFLSQVVPVITSLHIPSHGFCFSEDSD